MEVSKPCAIPSYLSLPELPVKFSISCLVSLPSNSKVNKTEAGTKKWDIAVIGLIMLGFCCCLFIFLNNMEDIRILEWSLMGPSSSLEDNGAKSSGGRA